MKYGVIVCSKCKQAKGIDLSFKTTRCVRCNKFIKIDKVRILYKTNSEQELRSYLGLVNADLDGKLEEFKEIVRKQ
jgi:hypothetical protein